MLHGGLNIILQLPPIIDHRSYIIGRAQIRSADICVAVGLSRGMEASGLPCPTVENKHPVLTPRRHSVGPLVTVNDEDNVRAGMW